jgi:hypothetical protein
LFECSGLLVPPPDELVKQSEFNLPITTYFSSLRAPKGAEGRRRAPQGMQCPEKCMHAAVLKNKDNLNQDGIDKIKTPQF